MKYIQLPDQISLNEIRKIFRETAQISEDGEMVFPDFSDQDYEQAPAWLEADACIVGAEVKER